MMMVRYYYTSSDNFMRCKHCWNTHYLKGLNIEDKNTRPLHRSFQYTGFRTHDASVRCLFRTAWAFQKSEESHSPFSPLWRLWVGPGNSRLCRLWDASRLASYLFWSARHTASRISHRTSLKCSPTVYDNRRPSALSQSKNSVSWSESSSESLEHRRRKSIAVLIIDLGCRQRRTHPLSSSAPRHIGFLEPIRLCSKNLLPYMKGQLYRTFAQPCVCQLPGRCCWMVRISSPSES